MKQYRIVCVCGCVDGHMKRCMVEHVCGHIGGLMIKCVNDRTFGNKSDVQICDYMVVRLLICINFATFQTNVYTEPAL